MTFPHSFRSGLVALAYAIAPSSAVADKKYPCRDYAALFWSSYQLAQVTQQVDGYHGFQQHPKDGKLGLEEYADHQYGRLFCREVQNPDKCAGRIKSKNADDWDVTMPRQGFAEAAIPKLVADLKPYDANRDGYLTMEDDVNKDGYITCQDTVKYVPPPKKINPPKNQPPQPPKTPRRR